MKLWLSNLYDFNCTHDIAVELLNLFVILIIDSNESPIRPKTLDVLFHNQDQNLLLTIKKFNFWRLTNLAILEIVETNLEK